MQTDNEPGRLDYDVVVVGAGFAGLYALHLLRAQGLKVLVIEAGDDVGGTWYWNRYPGARCDVPSLEYSYSFSDDIQQEWEWTERYATQPEIHAYLQFVTERLDLRRDILFGTRVGSAVFDRAVATWTVTTEKGDSFHSQFCVMATGALSASRLPDIAGIAQFTGPVLHTGRWPKEPLDLAGKVVGVIGTGSSAIQVIPQIAKQAADLFVFQRTPSYSVPARNAPLDPAHVDAWKSVYSEKRQKARETRSGVLYEYSTSSAQDASPEERAQEFDRRWNIGGSNFMYAYNDLVRNSDSNEFAASFVRAKISEIVENPETAKQLTPVNYPIGTKRICVDSDYYATYNRENVHLVDVKSDPIAAITATGLRTEGGIDYGFDTLVFATGFDAITGALLAMDIQTSDGLSLRQLWASGPRTYLGLTVAGIPNLFIVTGPGSPSVLSNMVVSVEFDVEWISQCIADLKERDIRTIEATEAAQDAWGEKVTEAASGTLYDRADSWYRGANIPGKPRVFMPYVGGLDVYQRTCQDIAADGYRGFVLGSAGASKGAGGMDI